jgi:transcriptional regulator with XRE-family HTH domain
MIAHGIKLRQVLYKKILSVLLSIIKGAIMLTIEKIVEKLKDRKLTAVAKSTGVSRQTVYNITRGQMPTYDTLVKLSNYFEKDGE